jgi:hypothetical protein
MHGPPAPPAAARLLPEDLGDKLFHVAALGQIVTVGAVSSEDIILAFEGGADAGGHGLLAGIEMARTSDLAAQDRLDQTFFAKPDANHRPI